ncbi:MAG: DUF4410 domain-containing protein [Planctomycetota bacterium]
MASFRRTAFVMLLAFLAIPAAAQSFGPTSTEAAATAAVWPATPPARIYVLPFAMDPALQEALRQQASSGIVPQGPVRQLIASRPRVVDAVTGYDRSEPPGVGVSRLVAEELARAGWPAVFWTEATPPPNDGWRLMGQVVGLDEGSTAARNVVGFGVGNKHVGIDVMLADPNTAGGQPFLILDSSDRGRMMPGTVAVGAVAGFNPAVMVGKHVVSSSGIADVTQQQRLADDIATTVAEAVNAHGFSGR